MSDYRTIVADPPWPSMHQRSTYHRGKPERHYSTMPVADIADLPVSDWAADDAHLWLWGVNRLMEDAYRVVRAWGFTPMSVLTWCKPGPGMGYYLRTNTEHCIFATRGKPMVPDVKALSSWYQWPRLRHSEKPHEFFEIVETVSPSPRLEMFARNYRAGWDSWGDEAPDASRHQSSDNSAPTDGGHKIGDPCEAIVAQFVYGPQTCMKTSVTVGTDPTWGTTHVACAEHGPRVTSPGVGA